jgi:hypothetical protein
MSHYGSQSHPVEALSAFLDQEIGAAEREEIESHLVACPGCRALLEDLRRLDAAVGAEVAPPVPAGLARRIRSRLGAAPEKPPRRVWSSWLGPLPLAAAASLIVVGALWLLSRAPASPGEESAMARNDAVKDIAPPAPRDADSKKLETRQEVRSRVAESKVAPVAEPDQAESAGAPAPHERSHSDSRDQPEAKQFAEGGAVAKSSQAGDAAVGRAAPGAVAAMPLATGARAWPIAIEAPPYHVVLTAEDAMVVSQGEWTCAVPIDAADGRRLARIAGSPAPAAPGGASATPTARALSPAAEAALDLIRERYRAPIEERCGPPPR